MKIIGTPSEPLLQLPFLNAGRGPGAFYVDFAPVHRAQVDDLPDALDALVLTADLQGRERFEDSDGSELRLLGETLPTRLATEVLAEWDVDPARCGVCLCGDFYTVPALDKRGGSGDVSGVWQAFAREFRWVAGVAGNHDLFGQSAQPSTRLAANAYYLDGGQIADLDGLRVAGIGGIVGDPKRLHRKSQADFVDALVDAAAARPDIVAMHDGPDFPAEGKRGSSALRETLEMFEPLLVVRGHCHWSDPFAELQNGVQILNVDCRVIVLHR